jgi:hypothetical protein
MPHFITYAICTFLIAGTLHAQEFITEPKRDTPKPKEEPQPSILETASNFFKGLNQTAQKGAQQALQDGAKTVQSIVAPPIQNLVGKGKEFAQYAKTLSDYYMDTDQYRDGYEKILKDQLKQILGPEQLTDHHQIILNSERALLQDLLAGHNGDFHEEVFKLQKDQRLIAKEITNLDGEIDSLRQKLINLKKQQRQYESMPGKHDTTLQLEKQITEHDQQIRQLEAKKTKFNAQHRDLETQEAKIREKYAHDGLHNHVKLYMHNMRTLKVLADLSEKIDKEIEPLLSKTSPHQAQLTQLLAHRRLLGEQSVLFERRIAYQEEFLQKVYKNVAKGVIKPIVMAALKGNIGLITAQLAPNGVEAPTKSAATADQSSILRNSTSNLSSTYATEEVPQVTSSSHLWTVDYHSVAAADAQLKTIDHTFVDDLKRKEDVISNKALELKSQKSQLDIQIKAQKDKISQETQENIHDFHSTEELAELEAKSALTQRKLNLLEQYTQTGVGEHSSGDKFELIDPEYIEKSFKETDSKLEEVKLSTLERAPTLEEKLKTLTNISDTLLKQHEALTSQYAETVKSNSKQTREEIDKAEQEHTEAKAALLFKYDHIQQFTQKLPERAKDAHDTFKKVIEEIKNNTALHTTFNQNNAGALAQTNKPQLKQNLQSLIEAEERNFPKTGDATPHMYKTLNKISQFLEERQKGFEGIQGKPIAAELQGHAQIKQMIEKAKQSPAFQNYVEDHHNYQWAVEHTRKDGAILKERVKV